MPISSLPCLPKRDSGLNVALRLRISKLPLEIIAVDDSRADLYLLNTALQESGIPNSTRTFTDGLEARRFCGSLGNEPNSRRPDLILLDLNLGRCDGFDVLETIRANSFLDFTPVIIVSTSQRDDDVAKSYELKANAYMFKSSSLDECFLNVHNMLKFWWRILRDRASGGR